MKINYLFVYLFFIATSHAMEKQLVINDAFSTKELSSGLATLPQELQVPILKDVLLDLAPRKPKDFVRLIYDLQEITPEFADAALDKFDIKKHYNYAFNLFSRIKTTENNDTLRKAFFKKHQIFFGSFVLHPQLTKYLSTCNYSIRDIGLVAFAHNRTLIHTATPAFVNNYAREVKNLFFDQKFYEYCVAKLSLNEYLLTSSIIREGFCIAAGSSGIIYVEDDNAAE